LSKLEGTKLFYFNKNWNQIGKKTNIRIKLNKKNDTIINWHMTLYWHVVWYWFDMWIIFLKIKKKLKTERI